MVVGFVFLSATGGEADLAGEYSWLRRASRYHRPVPAHNSEPWGRASRGQRRRRRMAAFWWVVGAVLLVAAVVGLIYFIYVKQLR